MRISDALSDPGRYRAQIERLHAKHLLTGKLYEIKQAGVPLASVVANADRVSQLLARSVSRGKYQFSPGKARTVEIAGKRRRLYGFALTDFLVHAVVAAAINECVQPHLSSCLYSYIRGRAWLDAITQFSRYVRAHRRSIADPRERGLYVLRRDICKYTDTIPLDDKSPLWELLSAIVREEQTLPPNVWTLIQNVIRPSVYTERGALCTNVVGVPTGSPISTTIFNVFLMPMDEKLQNIPKAFYARYSDDFIFAHPDADVVKRVNDQIDEVLEACRLSTNRDKDRILFFNGAGRSSRHWPESQPTQRVAFLGADVSFRGSVALKQRKVRLLLNDLKERAWRTRRNAGSIQRDHLGRLVCATLNGALNPGSEMRAKSTTLLHKAITDRSQLKELDYAIARIVLRVVTGHKGVRGFREVPYRRIRREWKLRSLLDARNRPGRRDIV